MLLGAIFCCLDSSLTIAACLSYKSPFVTPFARKELADAKRKEFSVANSDQLTVLKAYKVCIYQNFFHLLVCFICCRNINATEPNYINKSDLNQKSLYIILE